MNSSKRLKVLFLTRYPIEGASSRYRVFQYLPYLERMGVECSVQSLMDVEMYRLTMQPGKTLKKVWMTLKAIFRRLHTLKNWQHFDIIYMQRELFPFGPPIIEKFLKKRGAVLFFDYDDALFIKKPSRYNPIASFLRSAQKTRKLFRIVDCTVAGNDWLRDNARNEGGIAETIEVAEDTTRYRDKAFDDKNSSLTVGWLGSPSTVKYLELIREPLKKLALRFPDIRWEIIGGNDFVMEGVPWLNTNWSLTEEVDGLARFDIGLMPLPQDEWANGKSGGKARTYMAAGVVPVCQAIGYNLELIDNGKTGFLCDDIEDWLNVLTTLVENRTRVEEVSKAAKIEVLNRFSPDGQAKKMYQLFCKVMEKEHELKEPSCNKGIRIW